MFNTKRFTTAIATGAVLLNALAPVAFADTVSVTGNGAFSDNTVKVANENTTVVDQSNTANVENNISSNASTGGNSSSFNTGGDSRIVTGDAVSSTDVSTAVNLNQAVLKDCGGCDNDNLNVKISGNGAYSENAVKADNENLVSLSQDNDARISNNIDANTSTGKNDNSYNTGGDSIIVTGDAKTAVSVENQANANFAQIGGSHGNSGGSSVAITGNGAFSDNAVKLKQDSTVVLDQYNDADIDNDIRAKAYTGNNDASFSTGGDTAIVTGDAKTYVGVDNKANFNVANVSCDCFLDNLNVKISGNGAKSDNYVASLNHNALFNTQDNYADFYNDVDGNAKTGYNDVSFSTSGYYSDPFISTGDAKSYTGVSNTGNANLFNEGHSLHLPGDWELGVNFNLHDVMKFFHLG